MGSITTNLSITTAQPDVILVQGTVKGPTGECDVIRLKSSYYLATMGSSAVCNVECQGVDVRAADLRQVTEIIDSTVCQVGCEME